MSILNDYINAQSEQTWVLVGITIALSILFLFLGAYIKKQDSLKRPTKLMVIIEIYYDAIDGLVNSIFKGHAGILFPYAGMLIVYILIMNWIGLFLPVSAPTTDYNVPLALVVISFIFRYGYDFKNNGIKQHLKAYVSPVPVMLPLNLMDIVAKPLSMSMRLFGNLLSGSLIMGVFYQAMGYLQATLLPKITPTNANGEVLLNLFGAIVAPPLHFYFDLFAGSIQAFVFTLLTLIFTSLELDIDEMDKAKKEKAREKQVSA